MDDSPLLTLRRIRNELRGQEYHHANEDELETGIAKVLARLSLPVERQVRLDQTSRIDIVFYLPVPARDALRVGVEVKIQGTPTEVRRQCQRYAGFPDLDALMLVTTVARHSREVMGHATPAEVGSNPAGAAWLLGTMPFESALLNRGIL